MRFYLFRIILLFKEPNLSLKVSFLALSSLLSLLQEATPTLSAIF